MAQSITDRIADEYDRIRSDAKVARNKRMEEVHGKFPELEEIRLQIAAAGQNAAMELSRNIDKEDEIRKNLEETIEKLEARRMEIIREKGIDENYDQIRYECTDCMDTGFVGNEKCNCYRTKVTRYTYEQSNLSIHMRDISFDRFNFKYFDDDKDTSGISPLMRIKKAYKAAKEMTENFEEYDKSFLYFGDAGTGKTFLAGCIANELIKKGHSVVYISAGKLFEMMENKKYSRRREEADDELIASAYSCELLILDDLGAEAPSKLAPSFACDLLNERMMAGKKMIICTSLDPDELSNAYTQRFVSRFFEHFYALKFTGKDIRKQKMYE